MMLDPAPQRQPPLSPSKKRPPRTSHPKKWRAAAGGGGGGGGSGNDNVSKGSFGLHPRVSATATKHLPNNSNDSVATPSSVHVKGGEISLTRDLSDLSGSYMNGNTAVRGCAGAGRTVPGNVYPSDASGNSYQRPWRHAKVLSRLPLHPQPHADDESSVGVFHRRSNKQVVALKNNSSNNNQEEISVVDRGEEAIEVEVGLTPGGVAVSGMSSAFFKGKNTITTTITSSTGDGPLISLDNSSSHNKHAAHNPNKRTPIILILMDPQRKKYELMQLWMDAAQDTVRDVLQAVTRNLTDNNSWRQDYDGLFQVRNNHFSQLIHVLVAGKYDVVPGEVWVAKPWSMSAKATVGYASTLLNHLKQIGILQYARASEFDSKWKQLIGRAKHNGEDTVLVLSKAAQKRVYVPEGILKHHHACQFLSFTPPFEAEEQRVDVLSGATDSGGAAGATVGVGGASSDEDAASALSDSHYGGSEATSEEPVLLLPTKSQDQMTEEDLKSQAESTYSTTGSGSPPPRGRKGIDSLYDADGEDGASMVTRESSYKLKPRSPNAPLPHYLPSSSPHRLGGEPTSPQRGGGIGRLLSALNCKGNKHDREFNPRQHLQQQQKDHVASYVPRSNSRLTNVTTPLRRSFEDAEDMQSQCSGAPLLFTQRDTANWTTTVSMQ